MFIKPTKEAQGSIFDISEEIALEVMLYPANEDVPCPWDADVVVENGTVTITGGLGPGHFGGAKCVCTLSVDRFSQFYKVEVHNEGDPSLLNAIESAGWVKA